MANIGTEINAIIVDQGFNYHEFDSTGRYSTDTGLRFMARFEKNANGIGRRIIDVNVDRNDNGTYNISFGMGLKDTIAKSVAEETLGATLIAILRKEASRGQ
jgi:hypothetical protein